MEQDIPFEVQKPKKKKKNVDYSINIGQTFSESFSPIPIQVGPTEDQLQKTCYSLISIKRLI